MRTKELVFFMFLIILTGCGNKLSKDNCEFIFFEDVSGMRFPENVQIINCEDDLEGDIWVHLKFEKPDVADFLEKMDFQSYSVIKDNENDLQIYSTVDARIDLIKTFMGKDYVEIPKSEDTYIVNLSTKNQGLTYILNIENGLFWGHISYPE